MRTTFEKILFIAVSFFVCISCTTNPVQKTNVIQNAFNEYFGKEYVQIASSYNIISIDSVMTFSTVYYKESLKQKRERLDSINDVYRAMQSDFPLNEYNTRFWRVFNSSHKQDILDIIRQSREINHEIGALADEALSVDYNNRFENSDTLFIMYEIKCEVRHAEKRDDLIFYGITDEQLKNISFYKSEPSYEDVQIEDFMDYYNYWSNYYDQMFIYKSQMVILLENLMKDVERYY